MKAKKQNLSRLRSGHVKLKIFVSFLKKNYVLFAFAGCIGFVCLITFYKLFIVNPTYVYAKIKVGQGYWWANTQRPSLWYLKAIQQAKEQKDSVGKSLVRIQDVVGIPFWGSNQYDIYVTARLKVSKVGSKGTYNFNRETIGVSAPIDLEFPNVQFSGTVIALSEKPFKDIFEYRVITLYRKFINPWEYEQIQIGDSFIDGKDKIFEVLQKERGETNDILLNDFGKMINQDVEPYRYAKIKVRVRVKKVDGKYIFGEEWIVALARGIPIVINDFPFNDFTIIKIE